MQKLARKAEEEEAEQKAKQAKARDDFARRSLSQGRATAKKGNLDGALQALRDAAKMSGVSSSLIEEIEEEIVLVEVRKEAEEVKQSAARRAADELRKARQVEKKRQAAVAKQQQQQREREEAAAQQRMAQAQRARRAQRAAEEAEEEEVLRAAQLMREAQQQQRQEEQERDREQWERHRQQEEEEEEAERQQAAFADEDIRGGEPASSSPDSDDEFDDVAEREPFEPAGCSAAELKAVGNTAYGAQDWAEAERMYTLAAESFEAEADTKGSATVISNRAAARMKQEHWIGALADCYEALRLEPFFTKALKRRAECHRALGLYTEAIAGERSRHQQTSIPLVHCHCAAAAVFACSPVHLLNSPLVPLVAVVLFHADFETLNESGANEADSAASLQHCLLAVEHEEPKQLYSVFGVRSDAGSTEIRKAYRRLALAYHPGAPQGHLGPKPSSFSQPCVRRRLDGLHREPTL